MGRRQNLKSELLDSIRVLSLVVLMAALTTPGGLGQEARTQKAIGTTMKLPAGWSWASQFGDTLSIVLDLGEVNGREEKATGELYTSPNTFVGPRIDEIRIDVERNGGKGLKIKEGQRFAGQKKVAVLSYIKERGSDPVRRYQRTHYLWRREGLLFEWREDYPVRASGKARPGLSQAARSMKFKTRPDYKKPDKSRDYVNQRVRFKLPADWNWDDESKTKSGKKVKVDASRGTVHLFTARTDVLVKGERWYAIVTLHAQKSTNTLSNIVEYNKDSYSDQIKEVANKVIEDKLDFRGCKAISRFYSYLLKNGGDSNRRFTRQYYFKHKGHLLVWTEHGSYRGLKATTSVLKKARKGFGAY